jgi:hypothetical protein
MVFKMIVIYFTQKVLNRLIDFVHSIDDPLLGLIHRAERLLIDLAETDDDDVPIPLTSQELRRLADVQEIVSSSDDPVIAFLEMVISDHSK